jgi:glycosyltransferase involved in cell wall biosynthesis
MQNPFFTIGVPTFNRAEMLHRTVSGILKQDFEDFEVIIADNASVDHTETVVKNLSDPRVRYIRHKDNIGAVQNWKFVVSEARGDWVIVHQDDDYLSKKFLSRCFSAISSISDATAYFSTVAGSHSGSVLYKPDWFSTPIPLDWMGEGKPSVVPHELIFPFGLFMTIGMSPGAAFKRTALNKCWTPWQDDCLLFNERTMIIELATMGKVIADPWIGGVYISHPTQNSVLNSDKYNEHWDIMAHRIGEFASRQSINWQQPFSRYLADSTSNIVRSWCEMARSWNTTSSFALEVQALLQPYQPPTPPARPRPPLARRLLGRIRRAAQVLVRGY